MTSLLRMLSNEAGLSVHDVERIVRTAPRRYKVYEIDKRSGGTREIAQPSRELKLLQRILVEKVFSTCPVHRAATAYRTGMSIRDNALPHAGSDPILKMDFKDFFPSIRSEDWTQYCRKTEFLSDEDIQITSQICFRSVGRGQALRLSIGAPSSPCLSNLLMYEFDELVMDHAMQFGVSYTRYADDLTFSGESIQVLREMAGYVGRVTRELRHPKLALNNQKTNFVTRRYRRTVTGVVLGNDGTLSLGRDRKRLLSAQIHRAAQNQLQDPQLQELAGLLAFANVVEPGFLVRMRTKYGSGVVKKIQASAKVPRKQ